MIQEYRKLFEAKALALGYDPSVIERCLSYAEALDSKGLPPVYTPRHLSLLMGIKREYLEKVLHDSSRFYRYQVISKKNGSKRKIYEPLPTLKGAQYWILEKVLNRCPISKYAKAYTRSSGIRSNAYYHRGKKTVLNIDIKDFFPSIDYGDVVAIFLKMGYWPAVAHYLGGLCCHIGRLPQGAPTSPYLSNLFLMEFDECIGPKLVAAGLRYTRYSDDITISGSIANTDELVSTVRTDLKKLGFSINEEKLSVQHQGMRQVVTGIVVNSKLQVARRYRKQIRQELYYILKFGFENHVSRKSIQKPHYIDSLFGRIGFVLQVNPKDAEFMKYREELLRIHRGLPSSADPLGSTKK